MGRAIFFVVVFCFIQISFELLTKYDDRLLRSLGKGFSFVDGTVSPMSSAEYSQTWKLERILSFDNDDMVHVIEHPSFELNAVGELATDVNYESKFSATSDVEFSAEIDWSSFKIVGSVDGDLQSQLYTEARINGNAVFIIKQKQTLATVKLEKGYVSPRFSERVELLPSKYEKKIYREFVKEFGTHYVRKAEVGGYFIAVLTINWDFYSEHKTDLDGKLKGTISGPDLFSLFNIFFGGSTSLVDFFGRIGLDVESIGEASLKTAIKTKLFYYGGDLNLNFHSIIATGQEPFTSWSQTVKECPAAIHVELNSYLDLIHDYKKRENIRKAIIEYIFDRNRIPRMLVTKTLSRYAGILNPCSSYYGLEDALYSHGKTEDGGYDLPVTCNEPWKEHRMGIMNMYYKSDKINNLNEDYNAQFTPLSQFAFRDLYGSTHEYPVFSEWTPLDENKHKYLSIDEASMQPLIKRFPYANAECTAVSPCLSSLNCQSYSFKEGRYYDSIVEKCDKKCPSGYSDVADVYNTQTRIGYDFHYGCVLSKCVTECGCNADVYSLNEIYPWDQRGCGHDYDRMPLECDYYNIKVHDVQVTFRSECEKNSLDDHVYGTGGFRVNFGQCGNDKNCNVQCIKKSCILNDPYDVSYEKLSKHINKTLQSPSILTQILPITNIPILGSSYIDYQIVSCERFNFLTLLTDVLIYSGIAIVGLLIVAGILSTIIIIIIVCVVKRKKAQNEEGTFGNKNRKKGKIKTWGKVKKMFKKKEKKKEGVLSRWFGNEKKTKTKKNTKRSWY